MLSEGTVTAERIPGRRREGRRPRRQEYARLDKPTAGAQAVSVYLDYTGGSLYAEQAQLSQFASLLKASVLGNPHSRNPTSEAADALVERTREAIAEYFHTQGQYEVCGSFCLS